MRSVCEGDLELFDRHWNLVLRKATESAVVQPLPALRPATGELWPRAKWEHRHMGQMLVRGDCVVSVSAAPRKPPPAQGRGRSGGYVRWVPAHRPRGSPDISPVDWHGNRQADAAANAAAVAAGPTVEQAKRYAARQELRAGEHRSASAQQGRGEVAVDEP